MKWRRDWCEWEMTQVDEFMQLISKNDSERGQEFMDLEI